MSLTECRRHSSTRILTILLILVVPGFLALARQSWYRSPADPAHFQVSASKTVVSDGAIHLAQPFLRQTAVAVLHTSDVHRLRYCKELSPHPSPGVTLSRQGRAPPA